jgi:glutamate---cysteine ligase / carboxylate-amine ligase
MREQFTIGVEEEYQLVDPESGELRSRGGQVRQGDRSGKVEGEVHDTMLEIGTPICRSASEVAARLRERRFQAAAAAASEDLEIMAAGTHPFSGWKAQTLTDAERPRLLREQFRQVLRQEHIWGMHVHVAVPESIDRATLMNTVRAYTPHLLALSCSSPFHAGEDTGFASFRAVAWRRFPFAGAPPSFASEDEYRGFLDMLVEAGTIPDRRTVYWSVRPSSRYPTLELRMCDVCPRLGDAVAIAALCRAMVVAAAEERLEPIGNSLSPSLQDVIINENEWLAARDGLDAELIAPEASGRRMPVRDTISRLLELVGPVLDSMGDGEALEGIRTILERGNAAERMRARFEEEPDLPALVDWTVQETRAGTGMDRRQQRREAE